MLEIKHTICPSCSVGCGLNIVSKDGAIVGTYPYKRHPINEGKNCSNGRGSILQFDNKIKAPSLVQNGELVESDADSIIDAIKKELEAIDANELGIICSDKNTNEEIDAIKKFAEAFGTEKIGFYGYNFPNFSGEIANYDDINNAKTILAIGDIYSENPLAARRIVLAKENEAEFFNIDDVERSITALNADEYQQFSDKASFADAIASFKDKLGEDSVIVLNKIADAEDFKVVEDLASKTGAKLLPILNGPNSKGAMDKLNSLTKDEIVELIGDSKVLIVVNDNLLDYLSESDIKGKAFIANISNFEDEFTKFSNVVLPGKAWVEKEGSFTNAEGLTQSFAASADLGEGLSEIEIFEKLA